METLIKSYGLDYTLFKAMLDATNGIISGSSVLYEFLKSSESSKIKDFKPNDLDILISGRFDIRISMVLTTYLKSLGYTEKSLEKIKGIPSAKHRYESPGIIEVLEFKNKDKTIQIIYIDYINVTKFIPEFFDLSCCMVYWDPKKESIIHLHPEATLKGRMKVINNIDCLKVKQRIQKYEERGFKLCQKLIEDVTFEEDSIYKDILCHDVIGFEDIKIPEFIEKSEDGIVIKCGESYYGFEREYFLEYLKTHFDFTDVKNVFPYDNTINSMISPMQIKFCLDGYYIIIMENAVIYEHTIKDKFSTIVNILKRKDDDRVKIIDGMKIGLDKDFKQLKSEYLKIETKLLEERLKHLKSSNSKPQSPHDLQVEQIRQEVMALRAPLEVAPLPPLPGLPLEIEF
jgi:hypothetical protein